MANTYTLISSNVLTSSVASVTFSSIPATYTDLVLKMSVRSTEATNVTSYFIRFNGDTASNYSRLYVEGEGSGTNSGVAGNQTSAIYRFANGDSSTSNTFANAEHYIPSYNASQNKPFSGFIGQEDNQTSAYVSATANLWRNTAAITSLSITANGADWKSGSSFFLYGIKNS